MDSFEETALLERLDRCAKTLDEIAAAIRALAQPAQGAAEIAAQEANTIQNLAIMLRRFIWQANKQTGDSSLKVLSGKAHELLKQYGLQGQPLRTADAAAPEQAGAMAVRQEASIVSDSPRTDAWYEQWDWYNFHEEAGSFAAEIERELSAERKRSKELNELRETAVQNVQLELQRSERLQAIADAATAFEKYWDESWDNDFFAAGHVLVAAVRKWQEQK